MAVLTLRPANATKFVIVVDMQNDFVMHDGALPVEGAEKIIGPIEDYLHTISPERGYAGVLFTFDTHYPDTYTKSKEAQQDNFPPHCLFCTPGWSLSVNPEKVVFPASRLWMLKKGVFDMWEKEETIEPYPPRLNYIDGGTQYHFFEELMQHGVIDIEVLGVASDYCVRSAIEGLLQRGFHVKTATTLTCGILRSIEEVVEELRQKYPKSVLLCEGPNNFKRSVSIRPSSAEIWKQSLQRSTGEFLDQQ